jgi:UDP-glucuronate decarboxylase
LTIYGKGDHSRCFCYVDDLIDGLIKMMDTQDQTIGPINLGSNHIFSINELADKIIKLTKSDSKKIFSKLPDNDPKSRKPNLELAKIKLNWRPKKNIDEGLALTIKYFKSLF